LNFLTETRSVTSNDRYDDKKRKALVFSTAETSLALEATPKKVARTKTSQVRKTPPNEKITPAQAIPPKPVVPYTRKSLRLASSNPSKQLPLSSEMHSVSKRKVIKDPEEEAVMMEEIQEDDDNDDDYDEPDIETPNSSSDEEVNEDREKDVEDVGAEMEGAPEETIAAIDLLVEKVNRHSGNSSFEP
jgi:hypothetical protein